MKKAILLILFSVFTVTTASAQSGRVQISGLTVERTGENVDISFTAYIGRKAVPGGTAMIYAPFLTDGTYTVSLPPLIIQGKRAEISWDRHEWKHGARVRYEEGIYAKNRQIVKYRTSVPFQQWMQGGSLGIETVTAGCCSSRTELFAMAENILPAPKPETVPEIELPAEPKTVAEELAVALPFVLPASDFDPQQPIKFYDDERDNSLTVYYKINSHIIEPGYADNRQTLNNLLAAIDILMSSSDSRVERVVVGGFASPEGPFELNDRLAWERAVSVKEYIIRNTQLRDHEVMVFNGSADWRGLRMMVERDRFVPGRQQILDLIDFHPVWDSRTQTGRIAKIRKLENGESFRYLAEHIFPKLRNGAFIRVYFEDK